MTERTMPLLLLLLLSGCDPRTEYRCINGLLYRGAGEVYVQVWPQNPCYPRTQETK
jgi:hypothetical protein